MHAISTIHVTGPDAFVFLQGQLTNDLRRLETEAEILAAWCNPKGRVIWFGTVHPIEGGFTMSAPVETANDIVTRLTTYRFRSKVDFKVIDEETTVGANFLIEHGYPFIGAGQIEQFTPHMLNFDLLDAISFDKGCYTGQEIVARTHYKGASKRRTLRFESTNPVSAGDKIALNGRDVGEVLNVAGNNLLAVVPIVNAKDALQVGDTSLTSIPLPYMTRLD
ncbi:MAG: folate-binding protein YgfZ [Woeseiaceae bacterium]|nr:folate-binding protein YgfZ [Woeseiaceae bacterium]